MVLFGRYGFAEGKTHLNALQDFMRRVLDSNQLNISIDMRKKMAEHIDYIFSGIDHQNYESIIEHYMRLKKENSLPALVLDRKLMGLKINVFNSNPTDNNQDSSPKRNDSFRNPQNNFNKSSTSTSTNTQGRNNSIPSLLDIQINVSSPQSSYENNESNTNEPMHRSSSPQPLKRRQSDRWRRF